MKNRDIEISEHVRQKLAVQGEAGEKWLAELPGLIEELEQEWGIRVEKSLHGGSEAYVAQVTAGDGSPAVLKIAIPQMLGNTVLTQEVTGFVLAAGRGYVRLLRSDLTRRVLLLERLGKSLRDFGYSNRTQLEIICATLKESWVKAPAGVGLLTGAESGQWHFDFISGLWQSLGQPCSSQAYETALAFTNERARAYDPATAVLVHGDAHPGNVLQTLDGTGFKLIDPDGLAMEPAYDLGVLMREWPEEMLPDPLKLGRERCDFLSRLTSVEPQAIWQWGFIQCMSTGLLFLNIGMVEESRKLLKLTEAWSAA